MQQRDGRIRYDANEDLAGEFNRLRLDLSAALGMEHTRADWVSRLPFAPGDATGGTENELAVAVEGATADVDLPRSLGDDVLQADNEALQAWRQKSGSQTGNQAGSRVWEHSWVRVSLPELSPAALGVLCADIDSRGDSARFHVHDHHGHRARLPASYALRLALADSLARLSPNAAVPRRSGERLAAIFTNDNTAPEIISAYIAADRPGESAGVSLGQSIANENALRFLLVQALAAHANARFGLIATGQRLSCYAAPNPPEGLKELARRLPAEAYRRQFMNPCLSGFADGEAKAAYMHLCHETLSRSRLAAQGRLRAAGLAVRRTVTRLPCDTSLLNNGTHVSLGSPRLTDYVADDVQGAFAEKQFGDLVSKIFEHFLPLFVGTFSAAPGRIPFSLLRPEQSLGFLPHELAATQLRQTWQAWRRKAGISGALCGDLVPDARLLDYFSALPSTATQHGHDGALGNHERLKAELDAAGVYDQRMSFYDLYRLRAQAKMGFSGFEGRYYSLFPGFSADMAPAVDLQRLVTLAAYYAIVNGAVTHDDVPDDFESQSERRQPFFHAAIGLPHFYVRGAGGNRLLRQLTQRAAGARASKRHSGYRKVGIAEYGISLCDWLRTEAAPVVELLGAADLLDNTVARLRGENRASDRLLRASLDDVRDAPLVDLDPVRFNTRLEKYYRGGLRVAQQTEAMQTARKAFVELERGESSRAALVQILAGTDLDALLARAGRALDEPLSDPDALPPLIALIATLAEFRHSGRAPA